MFHAWKNKYTLVANETCKLKCSELQVLVLDIICTYRVGELWANAFLSYLGSLGLFGRLLVRSLFSVPEPGLILLIKRTKKETKTFYFKWQQQMKPFFPKPSLPVFMNYSEGFVNITAPKWSRYIRQSSTLTDVPCPHNYLLLLQTRFPPPTVTRTSLGIVHQFKPPVWKNYFYFQLCSQRVIKSN